MEKTMFKIMTLLGIIATFIVMLVSAYLRLSASHIGNLTQEIITLIKAAGYYAALVSALTAVLLIALSWRERHCRVAAVITAWAVSALVAAQTVLGFWSVQTHGLPIAVTAQALTGIISIWLLFWLNLRVNRAIVPYSSVMTMSRLTLFAMSLLGLEILLGLWLSSHHASFACHGFPQCNGAWLPPSADYLAGLQLFDSLSAGHDGVLSAEAKIAIHYSHRVGALFSFIVLSLVLFKATAINSAPQVKTAGILLGLLLFAQLFLAVLNQRLGSNLGLSLTHTVLAVLLMFPLIAIRFYSRWGFTDSKADIISATPVIALESISPADNYSEPAPESLYLRLKSQLHRTRSGLSVVLTGLPLGQKAIDDDLLEEIEASLLMADIGIDATTAIINRLTQRVERHQLSNSTALLAALKQELLAILKPCDQPLVIPKQDKPFVILVVGVNGAGKTTTIGKLANRLKARGHSVMLAAGDTFRAAAVEQLQVWGERNHIPVVAQHTGADSASVIFDALQSAEAKGIDVLIADTAGRLQTKSNLMDELKKIKRIMGKLDANAPHEVLLILDAGTGQNALSQAKLFNEAVALTGLVLTKLDGTAKGGVIFALAKHSGIPIRYIGIGESIEDLQDFHAENFVDALFIRE